MGRALGCVHERIDAVHVSCCHAGICLQQHPCNRKTLSDDGSHEGSAAIFVSSINVGTMLDQQLQCASEWNESGTKK
jgi:hypothetical protein